MNKLRPQRWTWAVGALCAAALAGACSDRPTPVAPDEGVSARAARGPAVDSGYVMTPVGRLRRECVHEIPNGAHVGRDFQVRRRDGTTFQLKRCAGPANAGRNPLAPLAAPSTSGWVEWAEYSPGGNFSKLTARWRVPYGPIGGGQLYYTFPGLVSASYIIQPVIQYGNNGGFGGTYWTGASWHCNSGSDCIHSSPINVNYGDSISGGVIRGTYHPLDGTYTWSITTTDVTTGASTNYLVDDTPNYYRAIGGAVEVYNISYCSQYPYDGAFYSSIALYDTNGSQVTPSWSANLPSVSPSCGFSVSSTSATVNLTHNQSPPIVSTTTTSPSPAVQYQPFTLTITGSGFDPATVQVQLHGTSTSSCPTACTLSSFTTKTTTQLVLYPNSLSIPGTYEVWVKNANSGSWATGHYITLRSMY